MLKLLVALAAVAAVATSATAAPTRMAVALDVPGGQVPEFLCVVTETPCTIAGCFPQVDFAAGTPPLAATRRNGAPEPALVALQRPVAKTCAGEHALCTPEIVLPAAGGWTATCDQNDLPTDGHRVAFVQIGFDSGAKPAVQEVRLSGAVASVYFAGKVDTTYVHARVLGGDFFPAPEPAFGSLERLNLTLHPRCQQHTVQLPPRAPTVRIAHDDGVTIWIGDRSKSCTATTTGSSFAANLPYGVEGVTKKVTVETESELSDATGELEATWTTAVPPRPLQLGYREISVSWIRHCLMEDLDGAPGVGDDQLTASQRAWRRLTSEVDDDHGNRYASTGCPQVTLVAAGARCTLSGDGLQDDDLGRERAVCQYSCRALDTMPAFQLPSPVRLARFVGPDPARVVAEWQDSVGYDGEELSSFEPPEHRSLIIYPADRASWRRRQGDTRYAIEVEVAGKDQRIVLDGQPVAPAGSPPWFRVAAPGLECADPVRIHVDGSREYFVETLTTRAGALVLDGPETYRRDNRFGAALGVSFGFPWRVRESLSTRTLWQFPDLLEPKLSGQVVFEHYRDAWPRGSWEALFDYEVGRMPYRGLELPPWEGGDTRKLHFAWYHRFGGKLRAVWWRWPNWHLGIGAGAGVGAPVWRKDQRLVGEYNWYWDVEPVVRIRAPRARRAWLELGLDFRVGEDREYFFTDFRGESIRLPLGSFDTLFNVRLRMGGG